MKFSAFSSEEECINFSQIIFLENTGGWYSYDSDVFCCYRVPPEATLRECNNIRGLARNFFEDSFIVNNITILPGKDNLFVAMPSYRTKQVDEQEKLYIRMFVIWQLRSLVKNCMQRF